jgi:hypothetical protein
MSRGPGRIERAIEALFSAAPDDAYSTADLIDHAYPAINRVETKHRSAVIRAAKNVCRRTGWRWFVTAALGGTLVFWNPYNVLSYAIGRTKAEMFVHYRSGDRRVCWGETAETIRARFEPGGAKHHMVAEGGPWWRHVQINIAERDGDTSERVQALRAEQDEANRQVAAVSVTIRGVLAARRS